MTRQQKEAWFIVGVFTLALTVFLVLIPILGISVAWGAFGLFGFAGFAPLIGRNASRPGEVVSDERDVVISSRATLGAGIAAFEVCILACMVPWLVHMLRGQESISVQMLPIVVLATSITFWLVRAVAMLALCGREASHVEQ
jgi:hypothetical protein